MTELAHEVRLDLPFEQALERVIAALKEEGFGVLTRIDIHDAFKEKLNADFRRYVILGACNPPLAFKALSARADAGMLLPCNVTVEEHGADASLVRIVDADAMMKLASLDKDPALAEVGREAGARLQRVAAGLSA